MKKFLLLLCCFSTFILAGCSRDNGACHIIFDTDIGNDIDDVEALDLLYKYMDEGRADLLGICLNKEGEATAKFIDLMGCWYGYPDLPVGIARNAGNSGRDASTRYTGKVCAMTKEDGSPVFPTKGIDYDSLPDGHILYRKLLASQPDHSVIIVSTGFLTNLARLLDTPGDEYSPLNGKELVAKKVKLLSIMAGRFFDEVPECNIVHNIPASQKTFTEWPTEIAALTWELGMAVRYPASSIENDFGWTEAHPLKEAYIRYQDMPYNNAMYDPTAVIYALEGDSLFTSSGKGWITVDDEGVTRFTADPKGMHSYMSVDEVQAENLKNYFIEYLTRKPAKYTCAE